jgi:hypothetical protein
MSAAWQVPQLTSNRVLQQLLNLRFQRGNHCLHGGFVRGKRLVNARQAGLDLRWHSLLMGAGFLLAALIALRIKLGERVQLDRNLFVCHVAVLRFTSV